MKQKEEHGDNPLIVHISCKEQINGIAYVESEIEQKLIDNFMPGPFTLILKKKECIPNVVSAGLDTVGIRMPQNKIAQELIKMAKIPIAAPSANISGRPSGTRIEDIKEELGEKVSAIIDEGNTNIGLESTVVKVIDRYTNYTKTRKSNTRRYYKSCGNCKCKQKCNEQTRKRPKGREPGNEISSLRTKNQMYTCMRK